MVDLKSRSNILECSKSLSRYLLKQRQVEYSRMFQNLENAVTHSNKDRLKLCLNISRKPQVEFSRMFLECSKSNILECSKP